jgi:drug/metabolite transporter (DMT)-like permease
MINIQFGIAIIFGTCAVILLSLKGSIFSRKDIFSSLRSESTLIGIFSAIALSVSVITFRYAVNSLEGDFLLRATMTSAIAVVGQAIVMIIYLFLYRKNELIATLILWRPGLTAGFFAAITTAAWFSAFGLYRAAPVRAIGQIELIFSLAITLFIFRQKITRIEILGVLLLVVSMLLVIFD